MNKYLKWIIIEFIIIFLASLVIQNLGKMLTFTAVYMLVYFIPILPWMINIKTINIEKIIVINIIGLALMPLIYIIVGSFTNLNSIIFIFVPLIVFVTGVYRIRKQKQ